MNMGVKGVTAIKVSTKPYPTPACYDCSSIIDILYLLYYKLFAFVTNAHIMILWVMS